MNFEDFPLTKVGHELTLIGGVWGCGPDDEGYVLLFPEYQGDPSVMLNVEMTRENWDALLRQSDLMETEVLTKAKDGKLYKAVIRKSSRQISQQVSWNVFRRDGYACRYCGKDDVPLTVDHLVLWEKGGPSIEANLLSACKKCNKTRGNTEYEQWLGHAYYLRVSRALTQEQREANIRILPTLDKIERRFHKVKR